jgi:amidase
MADELALLDAVAQAALVARGAVQPHELVDAAIARAERLDPTLNAIIHPAYERARTQARGPLPAGPLRGVPTLMKDIGGAEGGEPYCAGMALLRDAGFRAAEDSYFTTKVKAGGLVSLGRTNTPELALLPTTEPRAFGATANPWNPRHSAGGSSGGAGAAVAAGIVPVAHASDGGGSIRGPASMNGLLGLKPTRARCSFGPNLGERWNGFSCEFFLTRSVRDAAVLLDVVAGPMPGDPYHAPAPAAPFATAPDRTPGPLRVGVLPTAPRDVETTADAVAAVQTMARRLEALGHHVEEAHPEALDDPVVVQTYVTIVASNTARALESWGTQVGRAVAADDVEPLTWALADIGRGMSAQQLLAAIESAHLLGRRLAAWWDGGFDLLLTPTQGAAPPELGWLSSTADEPLRAFLRAAPYGVFTLPFNISGQPALSVPGFWTDAGLPIGAQLVASVGREDLLLSVAAQLEAAHPWQERRPALHA